jgi:hypothetical protein
MHTDRRKGHVKGVPVSYVNGHNGRQPRLPIRFGRLDGKSVAYIPLTQGKWAIIDREDLERVPGVWYVIPGGYVCQMCGSKTIYMHVVILPSPDGMETDHRFGDKLDNRKAQLRITTHRQNTCNRNLNVNNRSGYKGVSWRKSSGCWRVSLAADGKLLHVGYFKADKLIEAAKAYDAAAIKYHGEYARLNFPVKG